jgi:putative membrane-bound dehydrogenase-like protein
VVIALCCRVTFLPLLLMRFLLGVFVLAVAAGAAETEKLPGFPAVAPADAPKTIRAKNGFTLELIAAEPLVSSPVAVCYDENGAAYVAEMLDYPYTDKRTHAAYKENTTDAPIGRIRKLIDTDGDGVFDQSFVFADGLSWPTGVCCYKGGIFVTATPDIWYFKDTDGDNKADVREKAFTGLRKFNIQAVVNNPEWGLDNRITIAGGSNGGTVATTAHPEVSPLKILRNDLRLDPRDGHIEAIAGGARFGQAIGDWGDRFLCNIRNPAQHVVFDGTLTSRNPLLAVPNPVYDARTPGDTLPVLRISPNEPWRELRAKRWVAEKHAVPRSELVAGGVFTSAAGITVYRGAAYPPEYLGQLFVCEVANNLIQRQVVTKDGVTFKVELADTDAEFVASTDTWFRPVNMVNAPDGTLHIVDMYRETIEHPWSIPDDIHERLNLESGRERGRIYRLAPPGFKAPKPPRLGSADVSTLVATLENPNSWWRETAQRLLVERQDTAAVAPLRALAERSSFALGRLHALYTLDGLRALRDEEILRALGDPSAGVREHAVRLAAKRLESSPALRERVLAAARDSEVRVRYQTAFAAGGVNDAAALDAGVAILERDAADRWVRAAVLSATPAQCSELALRVLRLPAFATKEGGREVLRQLLFVVGAQGKKESLEAAFAAYRGDCDEVFWPALGDGLRQAGKNLRSAFAPDSALGQRAAAVLAGALTTVQSPGASLATREAAVTMLAYDDFPAASPVLKGLLNPAEEPPLRAAAIRTLGTFTRAEVATVLLEPWATYTPATREAALVVLLARRERVDALLTAIEKKTVLASQLSAARRTQLLGNPDPAIKTRATRLLGEATSATRAEAIERYRPALTLAGDAKRGGAVFDALCAACHRYAGRGTDIGPNLETVRGWDREKLLLNILDPNREVAPNYTSYKVELKDGTSLYAMIADENATSLTLKRAGAADETILRQNIAKLTSSTQSLMPEGLEAAIAPQAMADLLTFLSSL